MRCRSLCPLRPRGRRLAACLALAALLPLAAVRSAAQPGVPSSDQLPLGDLIEIVQLEERRELLAIDARGGGASSVRLRLDERVLWKGTRGLLGVVRTDARLLAVATGSASWQEVDYERGEGELVEVELGDRVALATTSRRVLGFVGTTSRFSEVRLGPREELVGVRTGANVAVAVTDRRALGLSPDVGGFFPVRLQLRERVTSIEAGSNLATVRTDARILVFRSPTGTWEERRP